MPLLDIEKFMSGTVTIKIDDDMQKYNFACWLKYVGIKYPKAIIQQEAYPFHVSYMPSQGRAYLPIRQSYENAYLWQNNMPNTKTVADFLCGNCVGYFINRDMWELLTEQNPWAIFNPVYMYMTTTSDGIRIIHSVNQLPHNTKRLVIF